MSKVYNYELERSVLSLPEFLNKGYKVKSSRDYSVTLSRENKDKTEEVTVYESYVLKL